MSAPPRSWDLASYETLLSGSPASAATPEGGWVQGAAPEEGHIAEGAVARRQERRTDRQDEIIRALREQIVSGELAPGDRLPNRVEIESRFGASSATVQRALERLKSEGFVVANRRHGTFVAPEPPHLTHYALVMPRRPGQLEWNRFWDAICQEAQKLDASGQFRIPIYYDVNGHEDSEDYQNLLRALANRRLAGLIFANTIEPLRSTPLIEELNIPSVVISASSSVPTMAMVHPDRGSFYDTGLRYLAERGCRRVAVLDTLDGLPRAREAVAAHNLETRPYWLQGISLWQPMTARGVAHLLMHANQAELPDGILIVNDNLVEPATLGMRDAGITESNCPLIVGHCNFPWPTTGHLPVVRLGFSVPEILRLCVARLQAAQKGETFPRRTAVPVTWDPAQWDGAKNHVIYSEGTVS